MIIVIRAWHASLCSRLLKGMVISMKKFILLSLCFALIFTLAACAQEPPAEELPESEPEIVEPSPEPIDFSEEEEMTGDEEDHPFIDDDPHEFSNTHNEAIVDALTPEDAYIHSDVESMLVLMSHMSLDEFIDFCLNAVDELGVADIIIDDSDMGL